MTIVSCEQAELDLFSGRRLRDSLSEAIHRSRGPVIVDLSHATMVDSSNLATLLNARRRLVRAGRRFAVVCPPGPGRRLFEVCRLEDDLRLTETLASARAVVLA